MEIIVIRVQHKIHRTQGEMKRLKWVKKRHKVLTGTWQLTQFISNARARLYIVLQDVDIGVDYKKPTDIGGQ